MGWGEREKGGWTFTDQSQLQHELDTGGRLFFLLCFLLFWIDLLPRSVVVRAVRGDPARAGATFAGGELQGCLQGSGRRAAALTSSATGCPAAEALSLQKNPIAFPSLHPLCCETAEVLAERPGPATCESLEPR